MGTTMIRLLGICVLTLCTWSVAGEVKTRDCTPEEKMLANKKLKDIENNERHRSMLLEKHLPFGTHTNLHSAEGEPTNEKLLVQAGYVTLHDGDLRTALWTAHELTGDDVRGGVCEDRVECFRKDDRVEPNGYSAVKEDYDEPSDYTGPEFDKGHMTSDRDLRDDIIEQVNSYIMSNMSPQYEGFNRGIWLRLEELGRAWAKKYGAVHVTAGAVFNTNENNACDGDADVKRVPTESGIGRVGIPTHYYKVFLRKHKTGEWSSISFLLEHKPGGSGGRTKARLTSAIKSMKKIEKAAMINLHPDLNHERVDQKENWEGWGYLPRERMDQAACDS